MSRRSADRREAPPPLTAGALCKGGQNPPQPDTPRPPPPGGSGGALKTCPRCGQTVPDPPDLPVARLLRGLSYLGRQVFLIDGDASLWATGGRSPFRSGTSRVCYAPARNGRGHATASRTVVLYRIDDLTAQLRGE